MEINASQITLGTLQTKQPAAPSEPQQIDAFTRALFGQSVKAPEDIAATGFQEKAQNVEKTLRAVNDAEKSLGSPITMLNTQSALLRSIFQVDLIAKAAGSVSQSINKLTSMQ